ncbi:MAG TPA: protein kinase [Phycisphaerae bacterium]|nr:protein kinase [Phycisphaerae bacterium]
MDTTLLTTGEQEKLASHSESQAKTQTFPRVAGYHVIRSLGHGGQGYVFQAIRGADGLKVAIKFILPSHGHDSRARAIFEKERQTLELLKHRSVVRVVDQGSLESGELWFAAEYIDGVPVNEYVHALDRAALAEKSSSSRPEFPLKKVLELFVQICEAVEAAHRAGVIHRDLKPANILVDVDGVPHVLDFGIARSPWHGSPDAASMTGEFMGSLVWSSPEQLEARPSLIDVRTDVYSIGMMLYYAMTGAFPFDTNQETLLPVEIRTAKIIPPREIRSFIDADLQTIVLTAIARDKNRRYSTVEALRNDILLYQAGRPITARPPSRMYKLTKFVARNRVLAASIVFGIALTAAYLVSVTHLYRRAEANAADARTKFRAARDMLDFTLSQIDTELTKFAGASSLRRSLLEKAYFQLEAFLEEKNDDPQLQADLAKTHTRLADIAQSLGRPEKAASAAAAALDLRRKLAAPNSADAEAQAHLSIALVRVGDIAVARGDSRRGHELYEQALVIDEGLVAREPDKAKWLEQLSWSYDRLCWAAILNQDWPHAANLHEKRLKLARRLFEIDHASTVHRKNLLAALLQTGTTNTLGPPAEGPTLVERAAEADPLLASLLAVEPDNPDYLAHAYTLHMLRAEIAKQEARLADARSSTLEAVAIANRILAAEPENRDWGGRRIVAFRELGSYALNESEYGAARDLYSQALDQATTLGSRLPADVNLTTLQGDARIELAKTLWRESRTDEAHTQFAEAIRLFKQCVAHPGAEPGHYGLLAEWLATCPVEELREPVLAIELAQKAVERSLRHSPTLLLVLAITQRESGQISQARRTAEEALALLRPVPTPMRKQIEDLLATLPEQ